MGHRRLHLNVGINSTGYVGSSWSWPGTRWNRFADFGHYLDAARLARQGVFDAVFLSDHTALQRDNTSRPLHSFDPIVLFSALAGAVPDIGFVLTASTSYNSPYNLARRLASLDNISGGRLVWNVVSSFNPDIAANFGSRPLPPRDERYRRAEEFIEVVRQLWLSWDAPGGNTPDEVLWNEETARRIDHDGEFFKVAGPLNVPVGPQGHPVISQAGASDAGVDLAGRHADLVYAALLGKQAAARHGNAVRERAIAHGRDPGEIRLLPGLVPIIGDTRREARLRHEALHGSRGEVGLIADLARRTGISVDPDVVLDPSVFAWNEGQGGAVGFVRAFAELVADEELTLRQLVRRTEGGHRLIVGTARDVADGILDWWADGTVDGFTLQPPILPDDLNRFVTEVVPLLQAEGAYPTRYDEPTMRGRFGLPVPAPGVPAVAGTGRTR